jgi:rfaE bifunctional protein kinase chain/domain
MITVVGDVIVDEYLHGELVGPHSEAVGGRKIRILRSSKKLGGAAAVAALIVDLGERPLLASVASTDADSLWLADELHKRRVLTEIQRDPNRITTVKKRVLVGDVVLPDRLDVETLEPITEAQTKLISKVHIGDEEGDAVILADYGKGVLSSELCAMLIHRANVKNTPIVVDPAFGVPWVRYAGATIIKANLLEAATELGVAPHSCDKADVLAAMLARKHNCTVIVTDGSNGMGWACCGDSGHVPACQATRVDITGCGDVVAAAIAKRITQPLPDICHFAAAEAAKCVGRLGVC